MSSPPPVQVEVEVDESMDDDSADMIPADRFTLPAKADAVVELWRAKMAEGVLSPAHFQDHWRVTVPRIYSPQPNRSCLDWSFDEELAAKLLIQPLEQLIWGSSEGSAPPPPRRSTLCGRVFKQGEPAYSCRECGMDNTCVLCVECFKVSAHRHHKYKIGQSGGGGCCDCGDTEAWKRDPFCELHAGPTDEEQAQTSISPEVIERMKTVASVCLSYCFRLLTLDHAPGLPNELRLKDAERERDPLQILDQPDCYCTVLYNDETHTFEQVITTLTRVMKVSHRDAVELVSLIDREGRALVRCSSFQVCDKLKCDIEMFTSRTGPALKVLVMHAHVLAHQSFAMKLLQWLQNFVAQEPSLRLAVSQVALGEDAGLAGSATAVGGGGGVAVGVMQNDCRMWKAARTAWHRLLIATTLMDYTTKKTMAILFTKNYGSILKDFIRDDHDHSFSVSSLSVQLYTPPTLAQHLIAKHDALFVVMNTFVSECNKRCNSKGRLEFDRNHVSMAFKRAQFVLYDVKYLLGSLPTSFDDDLRKGFLHGLSLMLNLLVMMQGMDSVVRQVGQHMEYEPEWESAFNLHVKLAHSITLSLEWCALERALCASTYRMALRRHADTTTYQPKQVKGEPAVLGVPARAAAHSITPSLEWCALERALCASAYRMALRRHADTTTYQPKQVKGEPAVLGVPARAAAHSITPSLEWCALERALCASAYRMALRRHADTTTYQPKQVKGEPAVLGVPARAAAHSITPSLEWCALERALCASAYRMALRRHADTTTYQPKQVKGEPAVLGVPAREAAHSITPSLEWCALERALCASAYRMALRRHADTTTYQPKQVKGEPAALGVPARAAAHSITLSLEWCALERALCASAYRMALRRHADTTTYQPKQVKELGNQSASVIPYDVSTEPVSIHRPLSRFLAGLHLQLHKHGLNYHSPEFDRQDRPKPPPEELIEPVLRTMAMIAQVHAGMWRRNGFALLNQLYFYHNVKCRSEMLDRDVVMLQIGASLIESNEFIIHVLNKFNLLEWAAADFEQRGVEDDSLRHTISMLEEFLGLLITVVGSRYVPGVGEVSNEDRTKKEIIQMLCVKPMPHSELNRSLPEDQLHETGLEAVIHEVADFIKPTGGNNRGVYKLKPHLYDEYDTFFYHYTREELSRSEEEQRSRRKTAGLPECCPPPPLPKLTPPFRLLASLLQCDAAMHVLRTVLERALDLRARSFSETQVHKALHLMGYALRDEESGHYEFLAFAESAQRAGLLALLQRLVASPRVDAHRPLAKWLLLKMRTLLGQADEHCGDGEHMETDQEEKPPNEDAAEAERARRAKLAAERRAKVMAQMKAQMNNFISNNAVLFEETTTEVTAEEQEIRPLYCGAALGVWGGGVSEAPRVCIMCQEEARVELTAEPLVLVSFACGSAVLPAAAACPRAHVSVCGHALHAACASHYVRGVLERETRRPYRLRQPAAFDAEKKEYLCPLCERLCNTSLPLLPAPALPPGAPPPLAEEVFRDSIALILQHQVCSEAVHVCTESCEEMLCQARARSVEAQSSDMEDGDSPDEAPVYMLTQSQDLLPQEFLVHFEGDIPSYTDDLKRLITEFVNILPAVCGDTEATNPLASIETLYKATSYTILSTNSVLQAEKRPLLGDLPSRHRDALQALVRLAAVMPSVWPSHKQLAHHALENLNTLERTSPMLHHPFETLVALVLTIPSIFSTPAGPARPNHLARQLTIEVFRCLITRAMVVLDVSACLNHEPMEGHEDYRPPKPDLENLLPIIKSLRKGDLDIDNLNANEVWEKIKNQCYTFLRASCLFYHFLSDISPPTELTVVGGDTWEVMCGYLDLPSTFRELIDTPMARSKAEDWAAMSTEWFAGEIEAKSVLETNEPPKLVPLPDDFSELMNVVSEFSCPNSEREDSKYPTMCLVCGQILCSQSYCCQTEIKKSGRSGASELVGAVVAHAMSCGAGAGVFLRVRDCELLLLAAPARGAMLPAPYLDTYGETDQGLRRGNPLRLCAARYETLRMLWLSHGLHERIARALDTNMLVTTQWQNM